jgi:hypothetical protein
VSCCSSNSLAMACNSCCCANVSPASFLRAPYVSKLVTQASRILLLLQPSLMPSWPRLMAVSLLALTLGQDSTYQTMTEGSCVSPAMHFCLTTTFFQHYKALPPPYMHCCLALPSQRPVLAVSLCPTSPGTCILPFDQPQPVKTPYTTPPSSIVTQA